MPGSYEQIGERGQGQGRWYRALTPKKIALGIVVGMVIITTITVAGEAESQLEA
jgi:hypothetical protein